MGFAIENAFYLWVIFAFIIGAYSRNKGGSFLAGFCFSLLLSPLLTALILAVRKPQQEVIEHREIASGNKKRCPYCAEIIRAEATKCRFCGEVV